MTPKKPKAETPIDFTRLEECSSAELALLARRAGHEHAHALHGKETLIRFILGELPSPADPVADKRQQIGNFVAMNQRLINRSLLSCDLNCAECPATKVLECFVVNKEKL